MNEDLFCSYSWKFLSKAQPAPLQRSDGKTRARFGGEGLFLKVNLNTFLYASLKVHAQLVIRKSREGFEENLPHTCFVWRGEVVRRVLGYVASAKRVSGHASHRFRRVSRALCLKQNALVANHGFDRKSCKAFWKLASSSAS
jgi:hypothetical protein